MCNWILVNILELKLFKKNIGNLVFNVFYINIVIRFKRFVLVFGGLYKILIKFFLWLLLVLV